MWDPLFEWADGEIMTSAKFASPNWVEDEDNHLMGLFVPSVPGWVKENEFEAKTPYPLESGKELRISAEIFSIEGGSVLDAVALWADEHGGFPEPKPWPRSLDEEMALCRTAYLSTLWNPEAKGWPHCVDWGPAPYRANISMLWIDSMMSDDPDVRSADREVATTVLDALKGHGPAALVAFDVHIPQCQLPYLVGDLDGAFGARDKMYGRINLFRWRNIRDAQINLELRPKEWKWLYLKAEFHKFWLDEKKDSWSLNSKLYRDKSGNSGDEVGKEFDLVCRFNLPKGNQIQTGYGHFWPDEFAKKLASDKQANWFFLQWQYKFSWKML